MRTEAEIANQIKLLQENLRDWTEPGGLLVPTEPKKKERRRIRHGLEVSIWNLRWALGEVQR